MQQEHEYTDTAFVEVLIGKINKESQLVVSKIARAMLENNNQENSINGEIRVMMKTFPRSVETFYQLIDDPHVFEDEELRTMVKGFVSNFTSVALSVRFLYPEFTCLTNMFLRTVEYIYKLVPAIMGGHGQAADTLGKPDFLLSSNFISNMQLYMGDRRKATSEAENCRNGGFKLNPCFRKLAAMYGGCRQETPATGHDVCEAVVMKEFSLQKWTTTGLIHLDKASARDGKSTCSLNRASLTPTWTIKTQL